MPDPAFFQPDLFDFLRKLKRHNNREWFAKNKQRYEEVIRDPALMFISSFAPHLHKLSPHFVADRAPHAVRSSGYIATPGSRRIKRLSKPISAYISPTPAARTPMRPCFICTWSRITPSRRRAFGILTIVP